MVLAVRATAPSGQIARWVSMDKGEQITKQRRVEAAVAWSPPSTCHVLAELRGWLRVEVGQPGDSAGWVWGH